MKLCRSWKCDYVNLDPPSTPPFEKFAQDPTLGAQTRFPRFRQEFLLYRNSNLPSIHALNAYVWDCDTVSLLSSVFEPTFHYFEQVVWLKNPNLTANTNFSSIFVTSPFSPSQMPVGRVALFRFVQRFEMFLKSKISRGIRSALKLLSVVSGTWRRVGSPKKGNEFSAMGEKTPSGSKRKCIEGRWKVIKQAKTQRAYREVFWNWCNKGLCKNDECIQLGRATDFCPHSSMASWR